MSQQDGGNSVPSQGVKAMLTAKRWKHMEPAACPDPPLPVSLSLHLWVGLLAWKWVSSPVGLLQGTDNMVPMSGQEALGLFVQEVLCSHTTYCHCDGAEKSYKG